MTYPRKPQILIVDDDEYICKTLSAILQTQGYETAAATTAREAEEKSKMQTFDVALLDIKLPDMEGTELLAHLQEISPETVKIMITGYPSLKNAVAALNLGADSYIMKPIDPADLLKILEKKIEAQRQKEKIMKKKHAEWILSQTHKAKAPSFQNFLEETANMFTEFGLTQTQAKIYIASTILGIASAAEIAKLSGIRREEVYRTIPKLEEQGIIAKRVEKPRKFSALQPKKALEILAKAKIETMKEQIDRLRLRQSELVQKLQTIGLPTEQSNCSIEVLSTKDNMRIKLLEMTEKAKKQIDTVASLEEYKAAYMNRPQKLRERLLGTVKIRMVTQRKELDLLTKKIMKKAEAKNNPIELRQIEELPFNLMIVDDKEAIWGEKGKWRQETENFWTNDPTQIAILKMSFENLWQKSTSVKA